MQLGEGTEGEIDATVMPSGDYINQGGQNVFLNYTRVKELYGDEYNLSPRKNFNGGRIVSEDSMGLKDDDVSQDGWRSQFGEDGLPTRE